MSTQHDASTSNKPTTTLDLVQHYRITADILVRQPDGLSHMLAADYYFVAELLLVALRRGSVAHLVSELRGNLNRRVTYPYCQERNAVLQEVAGTIEKLEAKNERI